MPDSRSHSLPAYPAAYFDFMLPGEKEQLVSKRSQEQRLFRKTARLIFLLSPVIPVFIGVIASNVKEKGKVFHWQSFTLASVMMLFFIIFLTAIAYYFSFAKINKDIARNIKIVEQVKITRKNAFAINHSFYFYVRSENVGSFLVPERIYREYREGDEINVQYTPFSKIYY